MVKESESVIKIVMLKQAEMAITLEPNGTGGGKSVCVLRSRDPYASRSKAET
jgi:hypothetical protein